MKDIKISGEYRGFTIKANSFNSNFFASSENSDSLSSDSLEKLKKKIDNIERKNFKRTDIITDGYRGVTSGVVTSHVDDSAVWISCGRNRSKLNTKSVYLDTPDNRNRFIKITGIRDHLTKVKEEASKAIRLLVDSLEQYKIED